MNHVCSAEGIQNTYHINNTSWYFESLKRDTDLSLEDVISFLDRGGTVQIHTPNSPIDISRNEKIALGCHGGFNRSQVAAQYFLNQGIPIHVVIAGRYSAANPFATEATMPNIRFEQKFFDAFGRDRIPLLGNQLGEAQADGHLLQISNEKPELTNENKKFYKDFFRSCEENHFVCFDKCAASVLKQLIDSRDGSLEGIKISLIPWHDEVAHPDAGVQPYSIEAYLNFYKKVSTAFRIIN